MGIGNLIVFLNIILGIGKIFRKFFYKPAYLFLIRASALTAASLTALTMQASGPAFAAPKTAREHTWELTRSFGEAVRQQEAQDWLWLFIFFLAAGALAYFLAVLHRRQKNRRSTAAVLISSGLQGEEDKNTGDTLPQPGASQKRAWVRLAVQREVSFSRAGAQEFSGRGSVVNISGGGMLLKVSENLLPGEELNVSFALEPGLQFNLTAQVVWVEEKSSQEGTFCLAGIKFVRIRHGTQDRIVRWILQEQRKSTQSPPAAGESFDGGSQNNEPVQ